MRSPPIHTGDLPSIGCRPKSRDRGAATAIGGAKRPAGDIEIAFAIAFTVDRARVRAFRSRPVAIDDRVAVSSSIRMRSPMRSHS